MMALKKPASGSAASTPASGSHTRTKGWQPSRPRRAPASASARKAATILDLLSGDSGSSSGSGSTEDEDNSDAFQPRQRVITRSELENASAHTAARSHDRRRVVASRKSVSNAHPSTEKAQNYINQRRRDRGNGLLRRRRRQSEGNPKRNTKKRQHVDEDEAQRPAWMMSEDELGTRSASAPLQVHKPTHLPSTGNPPQGRELDPELKGSCIAPAAKLHKRSRQGPVGMMTHLATAAQPVHEQWRENMPDRLDGIMMDGPDSSWKTPSPASQSLDSGIPVSEAGAEAEDGKAQDTIIGRTLNEIYEVTGDLGNGAHASTYLVSKSRSHPSSVVNSLHGYSTTFAVKRMQNESYNRMGESEYKMLVRLHSPAQSRHVASVYESFYESNIFHLVLERLDSARPVHLPDSCLCPHASCPQFLQCPTRIYRFQKLMVQLLQGLDDLHEKGIIHTDLSPSNILYVPNCNRIKIIDLGNAILEGPEYEGEYDFAGACYRAPELLLGAGPVSKHVDTWAAGVIGVQWFLGELGRQHVEDFEASSPKASCDVLLSASSTPTTPLMMSSQNVNPQRQHLVARMARFFGDLGCYREGEFYVPEYDQFGCGLEGRGILQQYLLEMTEIPALASFICGLVAVDFRDRQAPKQAIRSSWMVNGLLGPYSGPAHPLGELPLDFTQIHPQTRKESTGILAHEEMERKMAQTHGEDSGFVDEDYSLTTESGAPRRTFDDIVDFPKVSHAPIRKHIRKHLGRAHSSRRSIVSPLPLLKRRRSRVSSTGYDSPDTKSWVQSTTAAPSTTPPEFLAHERDGGEEMDEDGSAGEARQEKSHSRPDDDDDARDERAGEVTAGPDGGTFDVTAAGAAVPNVAHEKADALTSSHIEAGSIVPPCFGKPLLSIPRERPSPATLGCGVDEPLYLEDSWFVDVDSEIHVNTLGHDGEDFIGHLVSI
ncbi:kinase-like domain-containing protein [Peziza echinospora]|nr:kinase-like domain-containing protein [Peziza echinospora]